MKYTFFIGIALFLVFAFTSSSSPALAYFCLFGSILLFLVTLSILAPHRTVKKASRTRVALSPPEPVRPKLSIPLTAQRAHTTLSDEQFELFAAAVIIGGEPASFTFSRHCGKSGDKGVDVLLKDRFGRNVCIQAKRYKLGSSVKSSSVREFSSSIRRYRGQSGYIVTTSTLTRDGIDHIADENFRAARGPEGKEICSTFLRNVAKSCVITPMKSKEVLHESLSPLVF